MKCEKELALLREDIRKGRKNKKITQEELAEKLEVSPTHVKHIESGHRKPSIEILFEITKILNISLDGVVFSKNESARTDTRKEVDRLLDVSDEASLLHIERTGSAARKGSSWRQITVILPCALQRSRKSALFFCIVRISSSVGLWQSVMSAS